MTSDQQSGNPISAPITDADRELCLRYLLGELSTNETTAFEGRLEHSPELATAMLEQSEMLCEIADLGEVQVAASTSTTNRRWIEILVTVAACLTVAYLGWPIDSEIKNDRETIAIASTQPNEDTLIALAWADDPVDIGVGFAALEIDGEAEFEVQDVVDDSSLSWVMAAVEAGVSIDG